MEHQSALHESFSSSSSGSTNNNHMNNNTKGSVVSLRIKSFKDVELSNVSLTSTVQNVKNQVRKALLNETDEDRYVRLIAKGRLLAPDSALLSEFEIKNGDVVHAVLAAAGVKGGQQAALARASATATPSSATSSGTGASRRYRGTGIGPGGRVVPRSSGGGGGDSDSDSDIDEMENQSHERLGFDRLRSSGLSRSEITAIRAYFNRQVDRHVQLHPNEFPEETDARRRRLRYEDIWMQAQGPTSEFRLNLNQNTWLRFPRTDGGGSASMMTSPSMRPSVGTDKDFIWGFVLGFFVGFVMLVWVWMPTVPHKQKLGILTGISFQLALSVLKQEQNEDDYDFVDGDN